MIWIIWAASVCAQSQPAGPELVWLDRAYSPTSGCVRATYIPAAEGKYAETRLRYDAATGAFFVARDWDALLYTSGGDLFRGEARYGGLEYVGSQPRETAALLLGDLLPFAYVDYLRADPDRVLSIERMSDGGTIVEFNLPPTITALDVPFFMQIDQEGMPVALWEEGAQDGSRIEFNYQQTPDGEPPLLTTAFSGTVRLASWERSESCDLSQFSVAHVEAEAVDAKRNVARGMANRVPMESVIDGEATPLLDAALPPTPSPRAARWRTPLIATGIALIVLGAFAALLRRRS